MPATNGGPYRRLTQYTDQELLEMYNDAPRRGDEYDIYDVGHELNKRYEGSFLFEVIIRRNGGELQGITTKIYGPLTLLEAQGYIHPLVKGLLRAYVENQKKEDLYFFVRYLHLGFEIYSIAQ